MSLIEQLQKISAKIFQQTLKTYQLKDVILHKNARPHNLNQLLSMYPNKGVGFHVYRKNWPRFQHIRITESQFKSNRFGKIRGMMYAFDKKQWKMPKRIPGTGKRGIWEISVGEATNCEIDNGIVYTREDFQAFIQSRRSWVQVKDIPPIQTTQTIQGQTAQNQKAQASSQQTK